MLVLLILVVLFLLLLIIYKLTVDSYNYWNNRKIPCLKPWPIFGNMGPFVNGKLAFAELIEYFYKSYPNERYVGFSQFLKPTLVLTDVELIKQIAIKDFDHFVDRRTFISEEIDSLFGKSLFSLTGQRWKNMRSTLSPAFSGSKMRSMYLLMTEMADQFIDYLQTQTTPGKVISIEVKDLFTRFANDVIATSAFGIKCDSLKERNNDFFLMGQRTIFDGFVDACKLFGYTLSPAIMKFLSVKLFTDDVSTFFRDIVITTMRVREENGIIRPDMIHLLMEAKKGRLGKTEDVKSVLTDEDIVSQALFFFFAGFETTSTLLCHMANELAQNEDVQKKLQDEIDEFVERNGERINYESLMELKYLDMVINETLRKWPTVPVVDRRCVKSYTIQPEHENERPVHIYEDDFLWIPIYGIHRDPKYFPEPERFDPERFNDENKRNIKQFSYLPFGIGPRNCIGARFALMEAKIVYFYLLSKFDLSVVKETIIPFKHKPFQFNVHLDGGFWVGLKPRQK